MRVIIYHDKIYFHLLTNIIFATSRAQWYLLTSEALDTVINTQEQHYKTEGGREWGIANVYLGFSNLYKI